MRRFCAISLVLFQTVFFHIVVPGHLRGVVTLSGKSSVKNLGDLVCGSCCSKPTRPHSGEKNDNHQPSQKDRKECAICFVAATLANPAALDLTLPPMGQIDLLPDPIPQIVQKTSYVHTYDACGPPAVA